LRGSWSLGYLGAQARFYLPALLLIWPGMLLAPALDRSVLRWMVRGVCGLFLGMFLVYYWHDTAGGWLETLVVGQRLLQVALPLWVVSYAGVVDDWLAAPLRRVLGPRAWPAAVALGCLGLLGGTGLLFEKHQHHLDGLKKVRDALVARVPAGSLVATVGPVYKTVGTPGDVPEFRLRQIDWRGGPLDPPGVLDRELDATPRPWFLAVLKRAPGEPLPEYVRDLIGRRGLEPVEADAPLLGLYTSGPEGASR
jgi:hypothetical protein